MSKSLTKTFCDTAPLPSGATRTGQPVLKLVHWDGQLPGFGLCVTKNGARTFIAQGRLHGKNLRYTIGSYGDARWPVDDARRRAKEVLRMLDAGQDPRAQEVQQRAQGATLRQMLTEYLTTHRTGHGKLLRASTQADMRRHVEQNLADLADEPITAITRNVCLERFEALSAQGLTGQANQCMLTLRALLNYAREKYAAPDGTPTVLAVNPVTMAFGAHRLGKLHKIKPRDTRIPPNKIGAVWTMLQQRRAQARTVDEATSYDYVMTILLTGLRAGECARMKWENVNLEEGWFLIPEDDAKNHHAARLPMSSTLRALMTARQEAAKAPEHVAKRRADQEARVVSPYVFASWGAAGHITEAKGTMKHVSAVAGEPLGRHDLRRTFEDVAAACMISGDQRRLLLNHISGDVHALHYANSRDALAQAVEAVAQWIKRAATEAVSNPAAA